MFYLLKRWDMNLPGPGFPPSFRHICQETFLIPSVMGDTLCSVVCIPKKALALRQFLYVVNRFYFKICFVFCIVSQSTNGTVSQGPGVQELYNCPGLSGPTGLASSKPGCRETHWSEDSSEHRVCGCWWAQGMGCHGNRLSLAAHC